jgi:hypothetical protein
VSRRLAARSRRPTLRQRVPIARNRQGKSPYPASKELVSKEQTTRIETRRVHKIAGNPPGICRSGFGTQRGKPQKTSHHPQPIGIDRKDVSVMERNRSRDRFCARAQPSEPARWTLDANLEISVFGKLKLMNYAPIPGLPAIGFLLRQGRQLSPAHCLRIVFSMGQQFGRQGGSKATKLLTDCIFNDHGLENRLTTPAPMRHHRAR